MLTYLSILIAFSLCIGIAGFVAIDRQKTRPITNLPPLSFMLPCYNDAYAVEKALASIFAVCGPEADVRLVDNGYTDESRRTLNALAAQYGVGLTVNQPDMGRSGPLASSAALPENRIVVFVDADVMVSPLSLAETLHDCSSLKWAPSVLLVPRPVPVVTYDAGI